MRKKQRKARKPRANNTGKSHNIKIVIHNDKEQFPYYLYHQLLGIHQNHIQKQTESGIQQSHTEHIPKETGIKAKQIIEKIIEPKDEPESSGTIEHMKKMTIARINQLKNRNEK